MCVRETTGSKTQAGLMLIHAQQRGQISHPSAISIHYSEMAHGYCMYVNGGVGGMGIVVWASW